MASAVLLLPFYMDQLTTADFGALSIFLTLSLLVQLLVTYSYDTSIFIHYHEFKNDSIKLASFISSAFSLMLLVGVAVFVVLAVTGDWLSVLLFNNRNFSFFPNGWLAITGGVLQAIVKVHSSLLQTREKQETYFWSNLLLFIGIASFTLTGLYIFPSTLIGPLGGRALALAFTATWVVFRIVREYGVQLNLKILGESFYFNLYTFIYQLQQWVINYFDRVLMLLYLPLSSVGVYDFAIKCLVGVELFMNGLHSSFVPKVMKVLVGQQLKESVPATNRYYHGFIAVMMLAVCGAILVVPVAIDWLSTYLNKPAYKLSIVLIPYIGILFLLRSIRLYFGLPYTILKYTKPLPVIYSIVATVKIGGVILFAEWLGVMGVILASALSLLLELVLVYTFSKNRFNFNFNRYKILVAPITLLVIVLLSEYMLPIVNDILRHLAYCVLCVVILWFTYRTDLKSIKLFDLIK
jgi:O-antigen/teichoic acid export membrane protein